MALRARSWTRWAFFSKPLVVFLNQTLVFRQKLLAKRGLHFIAQLVGQVTPNPPEHIFGIHTLGWLFFTTLDAIGAVARRTRRLGAGACSRLCPTAIAASHLSRLVGSLKQCV